VVTVLSVDLENNPADIAPVAVSAAIHASSIPWNGPVSALRIGLREGKYFVKPPETENPFSEMELVVSSTKDAIVMIDAGAKEVPEKEILGGIEFAQKEGLEVIKFIEEFAKEVGAKKETYEDVKAPE